MDLDKMIDALQDELEKVEQVIFVLERLHRARTPLPGKPEEQFARATDDSRSMDGNRTREGKRAK